MQGKIMDACYWMVIVVICTEITSATQDSFEDNDDVSSDVRHRSLGQLWRGMEMLRMGKRTQDRVMTMLRPGRQVPMPRIGRRSSTDLPGRLNTDQLAAVLAAILDEPRDRDGARRQPPLPRYGRDSDEAARDIFDLLTPEGGSSYLDLIDNNNNNNNNNAATYFRPAPRGGRYKRSLPLAPNMPPGSDRELPTSDEEYWGTGPFDRSFRAVPFARIGRPTKTAAYSSKMADKKASPFPRIGRAVKEAERHVTSL